MTKRERERERERKRERERERERERWAGREMQTKETNEPVGEFVYETCLGYANKKAL